MNENRGQFYTEVIELKLLLSTGGPKSVKFTFQFIKKLVESLRIVGENAICKHAICKTFRINFVVMGAKIAKTKNLKY